MFSFRVRTSGFAWAVCEENVFEKVVELSFTFIQNARRSYVHWKTVKDYKVYKVNNLPLLRGPRKFIDAYRLKHWKMRKVKIDMTKSLNQLSVLESLKPIWTPIHKTHRRTQIYVFIPFPNIRISTNKLSSWPGCTCIGENPPVARWGVRGVVPDTINHYYHACPQSLLWLLWK